MHTNKQFNTQQRTPKREMQARDLRRFCKSLYLSEDGEPRDGRRRLVADLLLEKMDLESAKCCVAYLITQQSLVLDLLSSLKCSERSAADPRNDDMENRNQRGNSTLERDGSGGKEHNGKLHNGGGHRNPHTHNLSIPEHRNLSTNETTAEFPHFVDRCSSTINTCGGLFTKTAAVSCCTQYPRESLWVALRFLDAMLFDSSGCPFEELKFSSELKDPFLVGFLAAWMEDLEYMRKLAFSKSKQVAFALPVLLAACPKNLSELQVESVDLDGDSMCRQLQLTMHRFDQLRIVSFNHCNIGAEVVYVLLRSLLVGDTPSVSLTYRRCRDGDVNLMVEGTSPTHSKISRLKNRNNSKDERRLSPLSFPNKQQQTQRQTQRPTSRAQGILPHDKTRYHPLARLEIRGNTIRGNGADYLADFLPHFPSLAHLDVSMCQFGVYGCVKLATAVPRMRNLQTLKMEERISAYAIKEISNQIRLSASLTMCRLGKVTHPGTFIHRPTNNSSEQFHHRRVQEHMQRNNWYKYIFNPLLGALLKNQHTPIHRSFFRSSMREVQLWPYILDFLQ